MCQLYFFLLAVIVSITFASPHSQRIIGGSEIKNYSEFPYQLSLRFYGQHRCGGTILSATHAMSAAHCLTAAIVITQLSFLAGSIFMHNDDRRGSIHMFDEFFLHPKYNATNYDYDIAIVRVKDQFLLGHLLSPVRLATQGMPMIDGEDVTTVGWGITEVGRESRLLLKVSFPILDADDCMFNWQEAFTSRMICGGREGADTCSGDSGGPLLFRGLQVGIVSSGVRDCGSGIPSLYTSIANPEIRQFIRDHADV